MDKKAEADIGVLEQQPSTIEEQLKAEEITFQDLPEQEYEEAFISVTQQIFREDELSSFKRNELQDTYLVDKNILMSALDDPLPIDAGANKDQLTEMFNSIVYYPEEYSFWSWNKDLNVLIFFQNKMDRPVYYNQNGIVLLFLNQKNEVTFYIQTMLGESKPIAEKRKLIKPIRAIETLYEANELYSGDNIKNVKIGFHTRVPFESGVQVFAPIWKVNVNNEKDYFVNAIEGFIFSTKEQEFLVEMIETVVEKIQTPWEENSRPGEMVHELEKRLENTSG